MEGFCKQQVMILLITFLFRLNTATQGSYDSDGYHPRQRRSVSSNNTPKRGTGHETDWSKLAQEILKADISRKLPKIDKAKNLMLFIGDGMGPSSVTAGRWHKAMMDDTKGFNTALSWDTWPVTGVSKVYSIDRKTPDSAATSTAFSCGEKAHVGTLGVNQWVLRGDCTAVEANKVKSMLHTAMEEGKWGGIVTTARVTHATPAGSFSHSADRDWENDGAIPQKVKDLCPDIKDIAYQLIMDDSNQNIKVILGGGRGEFLKINQADPEYPNLIGRRRDKLDLIEEWKKLREKERARHHYVDSLEDFENVDPDETDYLLGLFEHDHMQYEADRLHDKFGEPSLAEMIQKTIAILSKNPKGYVIIAEGGRIDHAHHNTNAYRANADTVAMAEAVAMADKMTSEDDTLLVVTADHSHVFVIGGYPHINEDLYSITVQDPNEGVYLANDGKPYTALAYSNGPGWFVHRNYHLRADQATWDQEKQPSFDNINYIQDAGVPLSSETHAGEDVAVYARGPMAFLLSGTYEQSYIPHAMKYAACIGDNKDHCTKDRVYVCPDHTSGAALRGIQDGCLFLAAILNAIIIKKFL